MEKSKEVNPYNISLEVELFNAQLRNKALSLQDEFMFWKQLDYDKAIQISNRIMIICELKEDILKLN